MTDEFGFKKGDLENILAVLQKEKAVEQAIIFGSRAKGNYKNGSDVDIALKGKNLTDQAATHITSMLNEETLMPYKFDVLNYNTIRNKDLVEHIDGAGKIFYSKNLHANNEIEEN